LSIIAANLFCDIDNFMQDFFMSEKLKNCVLHIDNNKNLRKSYKFFVIWNWILNAQKIQN